MTRFTLLAAAALSCAGAAAADPHAVFGTFETVGGSHVTISDCGDGSPCGEVSWIDPRQLPAGITPDTAVTTTGDPILGLDTLSGFAKKKADWRGGKIYDPEADKHYASRLKRLDDGTLQVKGCVGPICQTQIWPEVTSETAG